MGAPRGNKNAAGKRGTSRGAKRFLNNASKISQHYASNSVSTGAKIHLGTLAGRKQSGLKAKNARWLKRFKK
jgi:hypothetical protein